MYEKDLKRLKNKYNVKTNKALAEKLNISVFAVEQWKKKNKIPIKYINLLDTVENEEKYLEVKWIRPLEKISFNEEDFNCKAIKVYKNFLLSFRLEHNDENLYIVEFFDNYLEPEIKRNSYLLIKEIEEVEEILESRIYLVKNLETNYNYLTKIKIKENKKLGKFRNFFNTDEEVEIDNVNIKVIAKVVSSIQNHL